MGEKRKYASVFQVITIDMYEFGCHNFYFRYLCILGEATVAKLYSKIVFFLFNI